MEHETCVKEVICLIGFMFLFHVLCFLVPGRNFTPTPFSSVGIEPTYPAQDHLALYPPRRPVVSGGRLPI